MSILIVGSRGNMGQRYASILRFLKIPFQGIDIHTNRDYAMSIAHASEGIIIATPTNTHIDLVRRYLDAKRPILVEKPITKDIDELKQLHKEIKAAGVHVKMVAQYKILMNRLSIGPSYYRYFKHGSDGLFWDCMQIIGFSNSEIEVSENSPVWECKINGKSIKIQDMDSAYIAMIQDWIKNPEGNWDEIIRMHEKTAQYELDHQK